MTAYLVADVLGLRVRLDYGDDLDEVQLSHLQRAWSGALMKDATEADLTVELAIGIDFERAMERLTVDVTLAALEWLKGRALLFHAAGVADEQGRVAAFVGPSGRGKTTLSRELGRRFGYVSDETIAVDSALRVKPYRKPLSVVRDGSPKRQVSPEEAGLRDLPDAALRLTSLALIERDPNLQSAHVEAISLADALPQLVPQMSYLRDQHEPLQTIAALCDAVGGIRLLRYPDSATVPEVMAQVMAPVKKYEWSAAPAPVESGPYSTGSVVDAIVTDGFVIAMSDATVHVLDGIAPVVWLACHRGECDEDIVAAVVAAHGMPPQGNPALLVEKAIDELISAGVLSRR